MRALTVMFAMALSACAWDYTTKGLVIEPMTAGPPSERDACIQACVNRDLSSSNWSECSADCDKRR